MDIASYLRKSGWELSMSPDSLIIQAPDRLAAEELLEGCAEQIAAAAARLRFKEARIKWHRRQRPFRVLAASTEQPTDETTVEAIGEVLSGPDDLADRKALDEVLQPRRNFCLVELLLDEPILCNRQLASLVQQTAAEWRATNLRRFWADDPSQTEPPESAYLVTLKQALRQQGEIRLGYDTWLTDNAYARFDSTFKLRSFQGLPARLVEIHSATQIPAPLLLG